MIETTFWTVLAVAVAFVLAAVACPFSSLFRAELASTIPVSGSAYTYSYATLGEICTALRDVYGVYEEPAF